MAEKRTLGDEEKLGKELQHHEKGGYPYHIVSRLSVNVQIELASSDDIDRGLLSK